MKPIEFKTSGVLWRLATFYGPCHEYLLLRDGTDVCSFTRGVLTGLFKVLLISLGCGIVAALLADTLGWLAAMIVQWVIIDPSVAASIVVTAIAVASAIAIVLSIFFGSKFLYEQYQERRRPVASYKPPSQLRVMYNAWKEKYCVPVTFKVSE